MDMLLVPTHND